MSPRLVGVRARRFGAQLVALIAGLVVVASAEAAGPTLSTSSAVGTSGQIRVVGEIMAGAAGITSYHLEYGPTTAYGSSTPDQQIPDPTPDAGVIPRVADETITGLTPSSTYHVRLVATDSGGTSLGADQTVNTLAQGSGDFTFVYFVQPGDRTWSRGNNWSAAQAGSPGRATNERVASLWIGAGDSINDVAGVTTGKLTVANSNLTGNAITLGSGGLTSTGDDTVLLGLPVQLSADQTWALEARRFTASGGLSGAGALTFALTYGKQVRLTGTNEVGDFAAVGSDPRAPLTLGAGTTLNAGSGKLVTVADATVITEGASVGALRAGPKATVQIGRPTVHPTGSLAATSVTLSPGTAMKFELGSGFGIVPGADYGQLSSSGPIDLAGATLEINHRAEPANGFPEFCENAFDDVGVGTVYTLVSTTAGLTGRFANAPDGSTFADSCGGDTGRYTINYTATAVTATVQSSLRVSTDPPFFDPDKGPQISGLNSTGSARVGVPVTAVRAQWSERTTRPSDKQARVLEQGVRPAPTVSAPQWEDCGTVVGTVACVPILGETGMTFTPGPTHAGRLIRFSETATSSIGVTKTASPSMVFARGTSDGSDSPAAVTVAQAKAALSKLGPPAKGATIRSLLKAGSVPLSVDLPAAGAILVRWYQVPAGAKLAAGKPKPKAVLVAEGSQTVTAAEKFTLVVKLTPAGKKKLKAAKKPLSLTSQATYTPKGGKAATKKATFKLKR